MATIATLRIGGVIPQLAVISPEGIIFGSLVNATASGRLVLRGLNATVKTEVTGMTVLALPQSAVTMTTAIGFGISSHAASYVQPPNFIDYAPDDLQLRLMQGIYVDLPTPVIAAGRPVLPAYVANFPTIVTLIEGPSDIHAIPDPNPVWNPATSGWYIQPPDSGAGDQRWVVDDLPDPAPFPGQFYWLGTPSSFDGTSGIATACRQWAPNGSTPGAPSWQSIYPYKPSVREHVNYGSGGNIVTKTKGVRFNVQFIEHMWCDFGSSQGTPFTWVIVGLIMDFPGGGYEHTILDVGRSPLSGGAPVLNENQLATDRSLSENLQSGTRPALFVGVNQQRVIGDYAGGLQIGSTFNYATRPRMFFGVFDGANSIAGNYSTAGKQFNGGTLATTNQQYVLLGRRSGILSRSYASHLVVFEMRRWDSALVEQQLDEQYGQLSSTWDFNAYT